MSEYTGTFSVQNNTGGVITNVTVMHATTDWPNSTIYQSSMGINATATGGIVDTSTTNKDRWSVSFTDSNGDLRTGQEDCGFESEDNGLNVIIVLCLEYFNIVMPASSSCDDNSYQQT
ncbi:MAG: hypothetical protein KBB37_03855 [Bacteroidia bacterium]|jgi:hypothetical protein|nr:hypothetical protein [Bacteroidia bacterium]MBP9179782.1 hypothetical protein [Bacteroidia bacterium]MBP9724139.1 hypothetical protein [Bacteroidia bacterium]